MTSPFHSNQTADHPPIGWSLFLLLGILSLLPAAQIFAADASGRFAVKGAGTSTCAAFVDAYDKKSPLLQSYGGWIDGFLSAANRSREDVFDLAPWQSTEVLAFALTKFCRENPELKFYSAAEAMINKMQQDPLRTASPVVVARHGGSAVLVYRSVLETVQQKLHEQGMLPELESGAFDERTAEALIKFQRSAGIKETGLPDQMTLVRIIGQ